MTLSLIQLRADTPGSEHVIHFNNAGSSLLPSPVIQALTQHYTKEIMMGGYEAANLAHCAVEDVYQKLATLIHAKSHEIALTENATRAWDMAFYSLPLRPDDIVLTSTTEYAGNYIPYLQRKKRDGIKIQILEDNEKGCICLKSLEQELNNPHVRLISLPILGTHGGPVQPVTEIGSLARKAGVWFFLDACQGVGHLPLKVNEIGCHVLTASGRKYLRAPRGTGFLWMDERLISVTEPVWLDHHAAKLDSEEIYHIRNDARRFECWEANIAERLGLGAAVSYVLSLGQENITQRIFHLARYLRPGLRNLPNIQIEERGTCSSGIVTFSVSDMSPEYVQNYLANCPKRINVSCSKYNSTFIDMRKRGLESVIRASIHAYNSEDEIDILLNALENIR
ncbi:aminotransferase class V-fold PLP-dependent enzyme [Escherichia coli]|uniref:aminotransferase class V-fold PLP-dependent enzyme n=1 Tax=Escherichia coli TaxID=562 RepID=UPI001F0E9AEC|nr:aminotransferase class V-fold PLP-dependent enzyme [Escherichia coli]UMS28650.1 aminotransferase [Escherichia coli]